MYMRDVSSCLGMLTNLSISGYTINIKYDTLLQHTVVWYNFINLYSHATYFQFHTRFTTYRVLYNGKIDKKTPTYVAYETNKSYDYFSNNPCVIIENKEAWLNLDDSKEVYLVCTLPSTAVQENLPEPPEEYLSSIHMKLSDCTLESLNHYIISNPSSYSYKIKHVCSLNFFIVGCHTDMDKSGKFLLNLPF